MRTKLLLPCRVDSLALLSDYVTAEAPNEWLLVVALDHSRFVWRQVAPCIFFNGASAPDNVALNMTTCLCDFSLRCGRLWRIRADCLLSSSVSSSTLDAQLSTQQEVASNRRTTKDLALFYERYLWFPRQKKKRKIDSYCNNGSTNNTSAILILPPVHQNIEYAWEERVIRLEHDRIRAQSVAGFYSTLGGGFFMTRRLQTANALAREQQRIALILGNKEMYYKCTINQAYNCIYGGHFQQARHLILQAWIALAHEKYFDDKLVLQNMCRSAMLFRKRVRAASRHIPVYNGGDSSMVDDFSRIRVVADQSSHDDLAAASITRHTR